jgi:hypothetical protein
MSPPRAQHGDPVSPLDPVSPWPPRDVPDTDLSDDRNASSNSRSKHPSQTTTGLPSAKEVYGSLAVLLTYLAFGTYLVWASAPAGSLDRVGWTWYPSRYVYAGMANLVRLVAAPGEGGGDGGGNRNENVHGALEGNKDMELDVEWRWNVD